MHLARSSAIYAAPIPLRLLLALTFIWAGLGKVVATIPVQGEQAALLANMGYAFPQSANPAPADPPETEPKPEPKPAQNDEDPQAQHGEQPDPAAQPDPDPKPNPEPDIPGEGQARRSESPRQVVPVQQPTIAHTAEEFPEPIVVRRLYGIALLTYKAAHPAADAGGNSPPPIWPEWAARDSWPIYIAWAAALTELVAGVLVLVGLLTRLSAISIASVMLTAMWLTELGPAIQMDDTFLGFLPRHDPWDYNKWNTLLWQVALIGSAVALLFAGPGALALDRAGGRRPQDEFDDEDDDS